MDKDYDLGLLRSLFCICPSELLSCHDFQYPSLGERFSQSHGNGFQACSMHTRQVAKISYRNCQMLEVNFSYILWFYLYDLMLVCVQLTASGSQALECEGSWNCVQ